ncbi:MAG: class I SAM-dependent methyltransferase [Acidobacteriota bacterium]
MSKSAPTHQKLRGAYYTPQPISDFLARWAIKSRFDAVLEPSCGDGILVESAIKALIENGAGMQEAVNLVQGVELEQTERLKTLERIRALGERPKEANIHLGDFFGYCKENLSDADLLAICDQRPKTSFDAIIGNPPFIRYQNFQEEHRKPAFEIMERAGLSPTRLTNSWVPFVVAASFLLSEKGRLALVIPAELLQVNYAAELRRFLSDYFRQITLITFRKLVFEGIQQEVVLLLAECSGNGITGIRTIELEGIDDLVDYEHTDFVHRELKPMDHSTEKWTQYFLSKKEIGLLRELRTHPHLTESRKVIDVDVGIVTGQNEFFVLNRVRAKDLSLKRFTRRLVSRSGHLKGAVFSEADWQSNAEQDLPAYILDLPDKEFGELTEAAREYVEFGQDSDFDKGFKCRIRNRWYVVPSVWVPDAFMLRQVHGYPKLILNQAKATCTDTIHRVRFRNGANGNLIVAAFLNSLTFAFSEVTGRSYGGGVLELEPNEAEKLPLPLNNAETLDLVELHEMLLADRMTEILEITDKALLIDGLGLSLKESLAVRAIWQKLRDRRINRKHSAKKQPKTLEEKTPIAKRAAVG